MMTRTTIIKKMTTENINFQPVPLTIHHDWSLTINRMKKIMALEPKFTSSIFQEQSDHLDMKSLGNISRHRHSDCWYRLSGTAINATMPWLEDMLSVMKDIKPDGGCISFLQGNGGAHIDVPEFPSALNYVFYSTDPDAHTWFKNDDKLETHSSAVDSVWLINTQVEHGIANTGIRYSLSIHFEKDYNTVLDWFNSRPHLTFGS